MRIAAILAKVLTFSTIFFKIVFPITVPAWITKSIRPLFSIAWRRSLMDPHQSPIRIKALAECPLQRTLPTPGSLYCPRKPSVPDRVHLCCDQRRALPEVLDREVQHAGWQHYAVNDRFDG